MATYAKILKDPRGNQILPYTRASLVYMASNMTVETAINNLQDQGGYSLPTATKYTLGGVKIGSNINISNGAINIGNSEVCNALGYTPADINTAKYLYHGNCAVDDWVYSNQNGYLYYINMYFSADNGGTTNLTSAKIMNPMSIKTGYSSTDATIQKNLNIIADGYMECMRDGILTIYTKKQPSSDITIYFEAQ